MSDKTAVVQTSGGLDSAAALLHSMEKYETVIPVFYKYGQIYEKAELQAASCLVATLQLHLTVYTLPMHKTVTEGIPVDFVPFRNILFTAHSVHVAQSLNAGVVVIGCKSLQWRADDPYSWRDSTLPAFQAMQEVISVVTQDEQEMVFIDMPLVGWTKRKVVEYLITNRVHPRSLWTCFTSGPTPCGECYHCKIAEEAFRAVGVASVM